MNKLVLGRTAAKRVTRALVLMAVMGGILWMAWQAVDEMLWEDSTLWSYTPARSRRPN